MWQNIEWAEMTFPPINLYSLPAHEAGQSQHSTHKQPGDHVFYTVVTLEENPASTDSGHA